MAVLISMPLANVVCCMRKPLYQKSLLKTNKQKKAVSSSRFFSEIKRQRKDPEVWKFCAHIL